MSTTGLTKTQASDEQGATHVESQRQDDNDDASSSSDSEDSADEAQASAGKDKRRRRGGEQEEEVDADELRALQEDLGQDARQGKRARRGAVEEQETKETTEIAGPSSQSDDVWKAMQSKAGETPSNAETHNNEEEMVRVVRTYRFAGEEVREEKLLPASHPDAKAFLAKQQQQQQPAATSAAPASRPPPAGPRRKKAGGGLAALSAAATAKPTKLNTLEKSKMDWTSFKDTTLDDNARHELDAQTKGGSSGLGTMKGYMERRNFLERVQDRLDGGGQGPK